MSSNDEGVKVNADGSIDLYLASEPVKWYEANTVVTNPDEDSLLMFRFYGLTQQLCNRNWRVGDPDHVNWRYGQCN